MTLINFYSTTSENFENNKKNIPEKDYVITEAKQKCQNEDNFYLHENGFREIFPRN